MLHTMEAGSQVKVEKYHSITFTVFCWICETLSRGNHFTYTTSKLFFVFYFVDFFLFLSQSKTETFHLCIFNWIKQTF